MFKITAKFRLSDPKMRFYLPPSLSSSSKQTWVAYMVNSGEQLSSCSHIFSFIISKLAFKISSPKDLCNRTTGCGAFPQSHLYTNSICIDYVIVQIENMKINSLNGNTPIYKNKHVF